jgi:hypothetical protein
LGYLPVPGLFLVPWLAAPYDPLARFHARQGGLLVGLLLAKLLALGLLGQALGPGGRDIVAAVAAVVLVLALAGMAWGLVGALRGRFTRVRPIWDLCALLWG